MTEMATCAVCGEKKPLCDSARIYGIKQPRYCKDCLLKLFKKEIEINDVFWIRQLAELKDLESLTKLIEQIKEE